MKKSIICLVFGIVAGIAMCLTAAYFLPESSFDDELGCFLSDAGGVTWVS